MPNLLWINNVKEKKEENGGKEYYFGPDTENVRLSNTFYVYYGKTWQRRPLRSGNEQNQGCTTKRAF